jgi:hypothetical protein
VAIEVELRDGRVALVQATMSAWRDALNAAIEEGRQLQIEQPDGSVVVVEPREIKGFREDPEAAEELAAGRADGL